MRETLLSHTITYLKFMKNTVLKLAKNRKSVRHYKTVSFNISKVLYAIETAIQAPSGANQQPWMFIIINDPNVKSKIRELCESGEKMFYANVKGELRRWLAHMKLTWKKPFLTEAPYLIAVFSNLKKPYAIQSTWLSIGYLLLALEEKGLASLTYTPPNPREVADILGVPNDFTLQTIIPVGLPKEEKQKEPRKKLHEVTFYNRWGEPLNNIVVGEFPS